MLILTGNNLGERHREINAKVLEAVDSKTDFEEVKSQEEKSDVDKLFKIDLASRYKNIEYILDVLKCTDVFHITRALKCVWLYNDEYSNYINPNYLTQNIFPFMSDKMQRKMLTAISLELKNGDRAIDFYTYCKEAKLTEYAFKFLILTPENYKMSLMKSDLDFDTNAGPKFIQNFVGNSIEVAKSYINIRSYCKNLKHTLRFLYTVSDEWYLDLLQNYETIDSRYPANLPRLGIRTSKDILKRHRSRVIAYPLLYINKLNKSMLIRYLTKEDVVSLTPNLFPGSDEYFWSLNFYNNYKFILEKIPANEKFALLKKTYDSKYGGELFELRIEFYKLGYYELLTAEEREAWALIHIERDKELPGIENFIWYRFVSFKKAFNGIKRYIYLTPDEDKRSRMVNILPETGRSEDDVKAILDYYYQRHINESETNKESFIDKIIEHQDIYSFDSECWASLDQLFYSLDVYTSYSREKYKARSMIYHILHNIELPHALEEYIDNVYLYSINSIIDQLSSERNEIVAKYMLNYLAEKLKPLIEKASEEIAEEENEFEINRLNNEIDEYIRKIWNVIYVFKRDNSDCPHIVLKYMEENKNNYEYHELYKEKFVIKTEGDFVRWLKQDLDTAIEGIYDIRCNAYRWIFRLTRLFRKLKVYFLHDVGKEYLEYFIEYLSDIPTHSREYRNIKIAVVGIFYLAEEDYKAEFLEKYFPVSPKIDRRNIDNRILQVQKAICRLAYHSRPPIPINIIRKFLVGDYIHFCLPIFNNYQVNLPSIEKFIDIVLDSPLSVQKHGLRLAFRKYSPETLTPIILNAWNKTKNVSLRKLLFETLFNRLVGENKEAQKVLYEILKLYTKQLNHDDHDSVYSLLVSNYMPNEFKGDFIETAWFTVSELSEKPINLRRRLSVINHIEQNIHVVKREFPRLQIIDNHLHRIFVVRKFKTYSEYIFDEMSEAKWNLTARYIVSFKNKEEHAESLQLLSYIVNKTIALWHRTYDNKYVPRKFLRDFISLIMKKDPKNCSQCENMSLIYQCILDAITNKLKEEEIYLLAWKLKLTVMSRKIIHDGRNNSNNERMSNETIISTFGKEVASMVKNLVEKGEFYRSFYQSIADIISEIGNTICDIVSSNNYGCIYNLANCLTDVKLTETHILAIRILPSDPYYNWDSEHGSAMIKIKQFDDKEVRCFFHNKYVLSDYSIRKYV